MRAKLWKAIDAYRMSGGREEHWRNRDALDQMIEELVAVNTDLLEALQKLCNSLQWHMESGSDFFDKDEKEELAAGYYAIAKATGKAP